MTRPIVDADLLVMARMAALDGAFRDAPRAVEGRDFWLVIRDYGVASADNFATAAEQLRARGDEHSARIMAHEGTWFIAVSNAIDDLFLREPDSTC